MTIFVNPPLFFNLGEETHPETIPPPVVGVRQQRDISLRRQAARQRLGDSCNSIPLISSTDNTWTEGREYARPECLAKDVRNPGDTRFSTKTPRKSLSSGRFFFYLFHLSLFLVVSFHFQDRDLFLSPELYFLHLTVALKHGTL